MNATVVSYAALIGMDWGHECHAIALRSADAALEQCTLEHSAETLHAWLDELHTRFGGRPIALAIESSRGAVIHALAQRDWITVYPIHPKTSARYREAFTPSGAKDDQPDAEVLLALIERHRDRLPPLHRDDGQTRRLDLFCRARRTAVDLRTQLLNRLQSLLQGYFPQALELCGEDLGAPLALDLLARWPTLAALQKVRPATLRSFYSTHNVRRPETVESRVQHVARARPLTADAVIIEAGVAQVHGLIAQLRPLQKHITLLDETIAQVFAAHADAAIFREPPARARSWLPAWPRRSAPIAHATPTPKASAAMSVSCQCFNAAAAASGCIGAGARRSFYARPSSNGRGKPRATASGPMRITSCKKDGANVRRPSIARSRPNGSASSGAAGTTANPTTMPTTAPTNPADWLARQTESMA